MRINYMNIKHSEWVLVVKGGTEAIDKCVAPDDKSAIEWFAMRKDLHPDTLLLIYDVIPLEVKKPTRKN